VRWAELPEEVHRIYEGGHTALLADERGEDLARIHELEGRTIRRVGDPSDGNWSLGGFVRADDGDDGRPDGRITAKERSAKARAARSHR